jgi:hypothetical protein
MNSFFGYNAGSANNGGVGNSFFGNEAGSHNTAGTTNSFFGNAAGFFNTVGSDNSFFGNDAGLRTTSDNNSFFGSLAGFNTNSGSSNAFFGYQAGLANTSGGANNFFGAGAGMQNTTGLGNNFFGADAGTNNTTGGSNTVIGDLANVASSNLDHATAIGAGAVAPASNQVQIGRNSLDKVSIGLLGSGASTQICMVNSIFSTCSSSRRYKENIAPFGGSLSLLQRLRPVTFDWKGRKEHDLGLVAEEVFEVEPLLITRNDRGEIEGVKYDKLTIVLINAVNVQQQQLKRQQDTIDAMKKLICLDHPQAEICKLEMKP